MRQLFRGFRGFSARLGITCAGVLMLGACTVATHVATGAADAQQVPQVQKYAANRTADQTYSAAVKAMTLFGTVLSNDRGSGIVQGQRGNWVLTANVSNAKSGAVVEVSARYVPGNRMDFNSREALVSEFIAKLENALGERVALTQS